MTHDLSSALIDGALSGRFGQPHRFFDAIGSTNSEALEWAANGAPEGAMVAADHQTGGRGRWGRTWFSAPGKLLQFSLILRPDLQPHQHGVLTAGLGVACARAIGALTGLPTLVKWPNDVVIEGRKIAGMLVESQMVGERIAVAVCGIGINVHLTEEEIPEELRTRASSIAIELDGAAPARADLLARILAEIEVRYAGLSGRDPAAVVEEATELSAVLGHDIVVRFADGTSVEGRAAGFDKDASLRVTTKDDEIVVQVGEIEQLRAL